MIELKTTLPRRFSPFGGLISLGIRGLKCYVSYEKEGYMRYFLLDSRLLLMLILLSFTWLVSSVGRGAPTTSVQHIHHYLPTTLAPNYPGASESEVAFLSPPEKPTFGDIEAIRRQFIRSKQKLIYNFTTRNNVLQTSQLGSEEVLALNRRLSDLFISLVLNNIEIKPHVHHFFTDTSDLHKIITALVEQDKYHVPASITLAQAALETSYGRKVKENNYFGIKDKRKSTSSTTTTEYYDAEEVKANAYKIIDKQAVKIRGEIRYKCRIKDHFRHYTSAWESFRAHSLHLNKGKRYAPLFTGGKNFEAWAEKIGSVKEGGVGYATDPVYGKLLKKIIRKYQLDLLDH